MLPKTYLSYSNGALSADPYKFRPVVDSNIQFQFLLENSKFFSDLILNDPIVILNYPSTLGFINGFTVIDTYLREATFIQAIKLSYLEKKNVLLIGQPLGILHQLITYLNQNKELPSCIGIAMGGYYCPSGIEKTIKKILNDNGCNVEFVYGYGVAEIAFGCFLGFRDSITSKIIYTKVDDNVELDISSDSSELILYSKSSQTKTNTGDLISLLSNSSVSKSYLITQSPHKLSSNVYSTLEAWNDIDWRRKTGYLHFKNNHIVYQLRKNYTPESNDEINFNDFLEMTNISCWYDKPKWRF